MLDPYEALTENKSTSKPNPHYEEFWIARLRYPGGNPHITIVKIIALGENGNIGFIPFGSDGTYIECAKDWALFELIEKIEMEKYK
jgi:hypothetical protein